MRTDTTDDGDFGGFWRGFWGINSARRLCLFLSYLPFIDDVRAQDTFGDTFWSSFRNSFRRTIPTGGRMEITHYRYKNDSHIVDMIVHEMPPGELLGECNVRVNVVVHDQAVASRIMSACEKLIHEPANLRSPFHETTYFLSEVTRSSASVKQAVTAIFRLSGPWPLGDTPLALSPGLTMLTSAMGLPAPSPGEVTTTRSF